jgi:hypothetical protein
MFPIADPAVDIPLVSETLSSTAVERNNGICSGLFLLFRKTEILSYVTELYSLQQEFSTFPSPGATLTLPYRLAGRRVINRSSSVCQDQPLLRCLTLRVFECFSNIGSNFCCCDPHETQQVLSNKTRPEPLNSKQNLTVDIHSNKCNWTRFQGPTLKCIRVVPSQKLARKSRWYTLWPVFLTLNFGQLVYNINISILSDKPSDKHTWCFEKGTARNRTGFTPLFVRIQTSGHDVTAGLINQQMCHGPL